MKPSSACIAKDALARVLAGMGTEEEEERLAEHLLACESCGMVAERLLAEDSLLSRLRQRAIHDARLDEIGPIVERIRSKLPGRAQEAFHETDNVRASSDATQPALRLPTADRRDAAASAVPFPPELNFLSPPEEPGDLGRFGPYRVLRVLGRGGMGVVLQAFDPRLDREVAIKTLLPGDGDRDVQRARFLREARAAAALKHDHVVTVHEVGEDRGVPFLVMELLAGESLEQRLRRLPEKLAAAAAVAIARQMAVALAAAHERGLVHCDIKPGNVWLEEPTDRVKLLDFGLARSLRRTETSHSSQSFEGSIRGTPAYMAPEQVRGETVGPPADLFGLGCVLYRMVVGRSAFSGPDAISTMMSVVLTEPDLPRDAAENFPPRLLALVQRLSAKNPADRPQSAREVADELLLIERQLAGAAEVAAAGADKGENQAQNPSLPAPFPEVPGRGKSFQRRFRTVVVAVALGLCGLLLAAAVYRVQTDRGTLVVEIDDEQIAAKLQKDGLVIEDAAKGRRFTIRAAGSQPVPAGNYAAEQGEGMQLQIVDDAGLAVVSREFKLVRKGKIRVRVTLVSTAPTAIAAKPSAARPAENLLPDHELPFVLVRKADGDKIECGTLQRALQLLADGDSIEVRGNGPFSLSEINTGERGFTLRAAAGYRPTIVASSAKAAITVSRRAVVIEGCDLHVPVGDAISLVGENGALQATNCRFLLGWGSVASGRPQQVQLEDCLVHTARDSWLGVDSPQLDLTATNNIVWTAGLALPDPAKDSRWRFTLRNNSIFCSGSLFGDWSKRGDARLEVQAVGNLLQLNQTNPNGYQPGLAYSWSGKLKWRGSYNLYVGPERGLAWRLKLDPKLPSGVGAAMPESPSTRYGLAGWEEFLGELEPGSAEARQVFPAWRASFLAKDFSGVGAAFQKRYAPGGVGTTEARRHGEEKAAAEIVVAAGPDWARIGPGDAFVRALAERGEGVAESERRPKPVEGAPFVLLRDGKVAGAFDNLQVAAATSQSGDVLELRTDVAINGGYFDPPAAAKSLTIRAAAGYAPVIEGRANWLVPNLTLTVEGLHFAGVALKQGAVDESGVGGRLARLANCSFSDGAGTWQIYSLGDPFNAVQTPAGKATEIVNCLLPGAWHVQLDAGSTLAVRNSVIGTCLIRVPDSATKVARVEFDRSLLFKPAGYIFTGCSIIVSRKTGDAATRIPLQMQIRHSIVENSCMVMKLDGLLAEFTGEGNAYRVGTHRWFEIPAATSPASLAQWQSHWKSDADSVSLEPTVYDPSQWQLLPSTPGQGQGPDKSDIGADVRRVARRPTAENINSIAKPPDPSRDGKATP